MSSIFRMFLAEHLALFERLDFLSTVIDSSVDEICLSLNNKGKLFLCGNGGSAADCQHISAELTGRFVLDRKPLAAIALTTDTSALTAIANDYSFDDIFSRQLTALGGEGDCLIGISTSGNSKNVIKAIMVAKEMGIRTIGLTGRDGGKLASICDHCIVVPSEVTARIQEAHILIGHTICGSVEAKLGLVPQIVIQN